MSRVHPSITEARIMAAMERRRMTLDDPGLCLACGNEQGGCEPDARGYGCEACGEPAVFGAEELFMALDHDEAAPSPARLWDVGWGEGD